MSKIQGDYTRDQKEHIARNLKEARVRKGLSKTELSEMTGIPISSITTYEKNGSIGKKRLELLGKVLGYPATELSKSYSNFVKLLRWDDAYRRWKRGF